MVDNLTSCMRQKCLNLHCLTRLSAIFLGPSYGFGCQVCRQWNGRQFELLYAAKMPKSLKSWYLSRVYAAKMPKTAVRNPLHMPVSSQAKPAWLLYIYIHMWNHTGFLPTIKKNTKSYCIDSTWKRHFPSIFYDFASSRGSDMGWRRHGQTGSDGPRRTLILLQNQLKMMIFHHFWQKSGSMRQKCLKSTHFWASKDPFFKKTWVPPREIWKKSIFFDLILEISTKIDEKSSFFPKVYEKRGVRIGRAPKNPDFVQFSVKNGHFCSKMRENALSNPALSDLPWP